MNPNPALLAWLVAFPLSVVRSDDGDVRLQAALKTVEDLGGRYTREDGKVAVGGERRRWRRSIRGGIEDD
jgi:hypothetical protein